MNLPFILWIACFLEIITYILRFGFDFHSRKIQHKYNLPIRIHHMYLGFIIIILGFFWTRTLFPDFILGNAAITILDLGMSIALSDILHHFVILPLFHQGIDFP